MYTLYCQKVFEFRELESESFDFFFFFFFLSLKLIYWFLKYLEINVKIENLQLIDSVDDDFKSVFALDKLMHVF